MILNSWLLFHPWVEGSHRSDASNDAALTVGWAVAMLSVLAILDLDVVYVACVSLLVTSVSVVPDFDHAYVTCVPLALTLVADVMYVACLPLIATVNRYVYVCIHYLWMLNILTFGCSQGDRDVVISWTRALPCAFASSTSIDSHKCSLVFSELPVWGQQVPFHNEFCNPHLLLCDLSDVREWRDLEGRVLWRVLILCAELLSVFAIQFKTAHAIIEN